MEDLWFLFISLDIFNYTNFFDAWTFILMSTIMTTIVMGAVVQKTNFCTMGAIADMVNFGSLERIRSWVLAIAVSVLLVAIMESSGYLVMESTFPNYRASEVPWGTSVLGGLIFGFAMSYAGGCGNKTLVNIGNGNFSSAIVVFFLALTAYFMVNPIPGSDDTIYSLLVTPWSDTPFLTISLDHESDLGSIILGLTSDVTVASSELLPDYRLLLAVGISLLCLYWVFSGKISVSNIVAGITVGMCVTSLWIITTTTNIIYDDENYTPRSFIQDWDMVYEQEEGEKEISDTSLLRPKLSSSFASQSLTFVSPIGQTLGFFFDAYDFVFDSTSPNNSSDTQGDDISEDLDDTDEFADDEEEEDASESTTASTDELGFIGKSKPLLSVGMVAVLGIILGSFLSSLAFKSYRFTYDLSIKNIFVKVFAGIAMGFGGILALGCTIGQGITGVSTLACGSFFAIAGIFIGGVIAQKLMYFMLMRSD